MYFHFTLSSNKHYMNTGLHQFIKHSIHSVVHIFITTSCKAVSATVEVALQVSGIQIDGG